jgi:CRP-like cAMP-binding protein
MLPIVAVAKFLSVPKNTLIIKQGEKVNNIYFIKQG